ncbi:dTDP-glucose 4,6 dehydratase, NAD(P)-binding [Nitrosotalea sinensis]|uniref:dTDP-glucose 4,6 dehydratase, NAD(P)-binding n=1 Tax=Nitrosotalea sinensis TaxID=1499975 RepID=A0A2H1EEC4_9ARCH|nr:dTDP-glucose 4,6-dehydratase [Candidatus Nitrosotalea sinensis]SHO42809.1 dTDP-glucose 4,6 dehydratase, NAD(P)-binding [Candidatus Nitrosotalea sinensis]
MRLLVCGGAGFIGSTFIKNHLQTKPNDIVTNLDNLTIGSNINNLKEIIKNKNYHFIKDDIKNLETISILAKESDIIINFAAETHVDRSISNPKPFIETNVFGTYSILEATRKHDKLFIHVSTDEIYGDAENKKSFDESDILKPSNPYSATKASADLLVESYHRTYGIKCITTRCTNNFGPYQFPEKLIPKTIIRASRNLKIPLYDGGYQIRSWIYVLDHVQAIESLIEKGKSGEVYNITSWNEITNKVIVEKILKIMGKPLDIIEKVGDRPGHDKRYSIDCSKIQKATGWKPRYEFEQALQETVSWYQNNPQWWEPLANEKTLHPQPWTVNW